LAPPPPPAGTPELVLIPETGVDLTFANQVSGTWVFLFLGLSFIGFGMVFNGVFNKRARKESLEK
jgi:hypothetical protein